MIMKKNDSIDKKEAVCITLLAMEEANTLEAVKSDTKDKKTLKRLLNEARTIANLGKNPKIASLNVIIPDLNLHFYNPDKTKG